MQGKILVFVKDPSRLRALEHIANKAPVPFFFHTTREGMIEFCRDHHPVLAILDIGNGGYDFESEIALMRSNLRRLGTPMIALAPTELRLRALKSGADEVFHFDIPPQILFARMRNMIRKRNALLDLLPFITTQKAALGFSEKRRRFREAPRVAVVGRAASPWQDWESFSDSPQFKTQIFSSPTLEPPLAEKTDLILLDGQALTTTEICKKIAQIQGQPERPLKPIAITLDASRTEDATLAFDLGVDEVIFTHMDAEEVSYRLEESLLRWCEEEHNSQRIVQQLERAMSDPLTHLANRAYALPQLENLAVNLRDLGQPYGVMLIDIDHFKAINDTYGHLVGDEALVACAKTIRSNLRTQDLVARFGGEEFLVLMPNTDISKAKSVAERLRERIAKSPVRGGENPIYLTVSIGVCDGKPAISSGDTDIPSLYHNADVSLYRAKNSGRNRVCIAP